MVGIIWHRTKVLQVLKDHFQYKPAVPGWQSDIFNNVTRYNIRKQNGNEYDGAIAFMLVQINSLMGDDPEAKAFIREVEIVAAKLMPRTKLGANLVQENRPA